jgi:hypothetical protein
VTGGVATVGVIRERHVPLHYPAHVGIIAGRTSCWASPAGNRFRGQGGTDPARRGRLSDRSPRAVQAALCWSGEAEESCPSTATRPHRARLVARRLALHTQWPFRCRRGARRLGSHRMATSSSIAFAASVGGLAGASLAARRGSRAAAGAALVGAAALGASEAIARARQQEGEIPALWQRIAVSTALAAPLGWVAGRVTTAGPRTVGTVTGGVVGALGIRPQKVALGPVVGAVVGQALSGGPAPTAVVASGTVLAYRSVSALIFRDNRSACSPTGSVPRTCRSSYRARRGRGTSAPGTCATWPRS